MTLEQPVATISIKRIKPAASLLVISKVSRHGGTQFLLKQRSRLRFIQFFLAHGRGQPRLMDSDLWTIDWYRLIVLNGRTIGDLYICDTSVIHVIRHLRLRRSAEETPHCTAN